MLALANPTSRQKIFEIASQVFQGGALVAEAVLGVIIPMVEQHALAQEKAQSSLTRARAALPSSAPPVVPR